MKAHEKPQYCNFSHPAACTMLNISLATIGVDTCRAISAGAIFSIFEPIPFIATSPKFRAKAYARPKDEIEAFTLPSNWAKNAPASTEDAKN